MNYTADSSFFIQLSAGLQKASEIWEDVKRGKSRLVVPAIVIVEIKKRLLRHGLAKYADELIDQFEASQRISIVDLTFELAKAAGKLGSSYNLTTADSVIGATALHTNYTNLITADPHFNILERDEKLKIIRLGL